MKHDKNTRDSSENFVDLRTKTLSHKTDDEAAALFFKKPKDFESFSAGNNVLILEMDNSTSNEKLLPIENVPDTKESSEKETDSGEDGDDYPDHFSLSDLSEDEGEVRKTETNKITDDEYDSQTEKLLTHLRSA